MSNDISSLWQQQIELIQANAEAKRAEMELQIREENSFFRKKDLISIFSNKHETILKKIKEKKINFDDFNLIFPIIIELKSLPILKFVLENNENISKTILLDNLITLSISNDKKSYPLFSYFIENSKIKDIIEEHSSYLKPIIERQKRTIKINDF